MRAWLFDTAAAEAGIIQFCTGHIRGSSAVSMQVQSSTLHETKLLQCGEEVLFPGCEIPGNVNCGADGILTCKNLGNGDVLLSQCSSRCKAEADGILSPTGLGRVSSMRAYSTHVVKVLNGCLGGLAQHTCANSPLAASRQCTTRSRTSSQRGATRSWKLDGDMHTDSRPEPRSVSLVMRTSS